MKSAGLNDRVERNVCYRDFKLINANVHILIRDQRSSLQKTPTNINKLNSIIVYCSLQKLDREIYKKSVCSIWKHLMVASIYGTYYIIIYSIFTLREDENKHFEKISNYFYFCGIHNRINHFCNAIGVLDLFNTAIQNFPGNNFRSSHCYTFQKVTFIKYLVQITIYYPRNFWYKIAIII
ncbi:hypothetical protein AGLY_005743 [Aphis glycines]|uniref:Uncharacterized protein n=1 Tax=Aphis glycines TaxID=307491 RepID=A0A6G0TU60_APHGL|nr:hypothetical protein AGLY_005743 [Aphis glycines]